VTRKDRCLCAPSYDSSWSEADGEGDGGRGETWEPSIRSRAAKNERRIVEAYGRLSTSLRFFIVITPWGTISWILKLWLKQRRRLRRFYLRTRRRTCESSFNERKQATLISSTATDRCHKTHVKENKLSTGDVLLKESINAIVRDMMKTAKIKHTPNTQPISVLEISIASSRRERRTTHEPNTTELNKTNTLGYKEITYYYR
jgi:hypothetical protein